MCGCPFNCGNFYRNWMRQHLSPDCDSASGNDRQSVWCGDRSGSESVHARIRDPTGVSSVLTTIDVSGDTNAGNKVLNNVVGSTVEGSVPGSSGTPVNIPATPLAFDFNRTTVFTANTSTDTVTQVALATTTAGFAAEHDNHLAGAGLDAGWHELSVLRRHLHPGLRGELGNQPPQPVRERDR